MNSFGKSTWALGVAAVAVATLTATPAWAGLIEIDDFAPNPTIFWADMTPGSFKVDNISVPDTGASGFGNYGVASLPDGVSHTFYGEYFNTLLEGESHTFNLNFWDNDAPFNTTDNTLSDTLTWTIGKASGIGYVQGVFQSDGVDLTELVGADYWEGAIDPGNGCNAPPCFVSWSVPDGGLSGPFQFFAGSDFHPPAGPGPSDVPEPASLLLLGTGLVAGARKWRKRRA